MTRIMPLLLIAIAACADQGLRTEQTPTPPTVSAERVAAATSEQTIQVGATFTPASVTIPANQAIRLHFRRTNEATCADEIVLPELNLRKKIAANETITFDLPAQQARTLNFACGMGMMKGTVIVQ